MNLDSKCGWVVLKKMKDMQKRETEKWYMQACQQLREGQQVEGYHTLWQQNKGLFNLEFLD